jgi:hypothetical protein
MGVSLVAGETFSGSPHVVSMFFRRLVSRNRVHEADVVVRDVAMASGHGPAGHVELRFPRMSSYSLP